MNVDGGSPPPVFRSTALSAQQNAKNMVATGLLQVEMKIGSSFPSCRWREEFRPPRRGDPVGRPYPNTQSAGRFD